MPLVSIIVPVYNVADTLARCVDSLLAQTLKDIEIILVDDGSPDNCGSLCDNYAKKDRRIRVVHQINAGLGGARNGGMNVMTGRYFGFLDSDDWVLPGMFEALYNAAIEKNAEAIVCEYDKEVLIQGKSIWFPWSKFSNHEKKFGDVRGLLPDVYGSCPPFSKNVAVFNTVWNWLFCTETLGNLRFCTDRRHAEDRRFLAEALSNATTVAYVPKVYHKYCINNGSLTRKYNPNLWDDDKEICRNLTEIAQRYDLIPYVGTAIDCYRLVLALGACVHELTYHGGASIGVRISMIRSIMKDEELVSLFRQYPSSHMVFRNISMKGKLVLRLMRWRSAMFFYVVMSIKYRSK